jgi:hypothetical protein
MRKLCQLDQLMLRGLIVRRRSASAAPAKLIKEKNEPIFGAKLYLTRLVSTKLPQNPHRFFAIFCDFSRDFTLKQPLFRPKNRPKTPRFLRQFRCVCRIPNRPSPIPPHPTPCLAGTQSVPSP